MLVTKSDRDRFHAKVILTQGCWRWTGSHDVDGYCWFHAGCRMHHAHRISYQIYVGNVGRLSVLHRCDNPGCVRPDHLFLGTNADNVADKLAKGRQARGAKIPRTKLNRRKVKSIKARLRRGETVASIARLFAVDFKTISYIRDGRTWAYVC